MWEAGALFPVPLSLGSRTLRVDLEDALARLEEARYLDRDELVANALMRVGVAWLQRRQWEAAWEALDEAHYLCQKLDNPTGRAQVCLYQAEVARARGELEEAEARLREALAVFQELDDVSGRVRALEGLGEVLTQGGRLEEASAALEEALGLAEAGGDRVAQLLFLQYLAPLYRRRGLGDRALATYRRLGELAGELNEPQRVALAAVGVGTLLAESGDCQGAQAAFAEAERVFRSLGLMQRAAQVAAECARLCGERRTEAEEEK